MMLVLAALGLVWFLGLLGVLVLLDGDRRAPNEVYSGTGTGQRADGGFLRTAGPARAQARRRARGG